jgi:glycosyltransferase involved in cell wall biosynthesis
VRIAFVSTILSYPWGGADTLWTHAAESAQARGDTLLVAVTPAVAGHPRMAALAQAGARFVLRSPPVSLPDLGLRLRRKVSGLLRRPDPLVSALRDFRPDLVVCSCGGTYDLLLESPLTSWLRETGTPYRIVANFQVEHPTLPEGDFQAISAILTAAQAIFFVSTRNLEVTRRHLQADLPQARVIQNPLRWRPADVSPWPVGSDGGLATVSRLDHGKGIHLLIEAAARALADEPCWRINVYGKGPAESYLKTVALRSGLADRVRFRGYVPELAAIWAENRLMVSPAIDDGVPMTIPEAMLCERPVLATAVGGAEDWLTHGRSGYLCQAPTLPLLAASLREAWDSRSNWQAMGLEAAAHARTAYRPGEQRFLIDPLTSS